jgi:hypothetical protein
MAHPAYIQKTLVMKPEVNKLFDDLEEWLDHCRFELIRFDPRDLYKSKEYKEWYKEKTKAERQAKKEKKTIS